MSMNIYIHAHVKVTLPNGKTETKFTEFETLLQTPTEESYRIVKSPDPIQAYKDYIMAHTEEEWEDQYDDYDDEICSDMEGLGGCPAPSKPPVKVRRHYGEEHIKELDEFIRYQTEERGAKVTIFVM